MEDYLKEVKKRKILKLIQGDVKTQYIASPPGDPEKLSAAIHEGLENTSTPTIIDAIVTRDPAKMLPAADNRTLKVNKGDRPV